MINNVFVLIVDGLADLPKKETPLKKAFKPNINSLLPNSLIFKFFPLTKKQWPKTGYASVSQYANLGILGYKVEKYKIARGIIEAIGSEIKYKDGWLAMRVDFGTVDENLIVIDRRAGRNIYGIDKIVEDINKMDFEIPFLLQRTYGHRGVLIFKKELSDKITCSDPLEKGKKVLRIEPIGKSEKAKESAEIVQKFLDKCYLLMNSHYINLKREKLGLLKVNYLLTREPGNKLIKIPNFFKKYGFKNGVAISENGVMKGTCKLAGFDCVTVPEMDTEDQMYFIFKKAVEMKNKYQIVYMHFKGADEAAHDKDFEKKVKIIEQLDKNMNYFLRNINLENSIIILTCDHITDCNSGKHEFGYVPLLLYSPNLKGNEKDFSEEEAKKSKRILNGNKLWLTVKKIIEKSK